MRYPISFSLLVLLCISSVFGQQQAEQEKKRYVIVPPESMLLVIASQQDCPLQIENAKLLVNIDRSNPPLYQYQLRNRGKKPIRSYTLAVWTSHGTGWSRQRTLEKLLLHGQVLSSSDKDSQVEIISLTNELWDKLKLRGPMKTIIVLMIEHIKFADDSTYSGQKISQALQEYFEGTNSEVTNVKARP